MIRLKNETDIKYIKKAIKKGEYILNRISRHIKPGVTPIVLNKEIERLIYVNRAIPAFKGYKGFPSASCISVNENIIHGVPDDVPLKNGDIVKIDIGIDYKGYISDQARTYFVGDNPSENDFRLVKGTQIALDRAISVAKEGNYIGDISYEIEQTAKEFGLAILNNFGGHGIGTNVHEEPFIPNRIGRDKDIKLVKGMVICIEPMFILGDNGDYKIAENRFNVIASDKSAHFESTVIIQ